MAERISRRDLLLTSGAVVLGGGGLRSAVAVRQSSPASTVPPLPQIDSARIGQHIVRSLQPASGERAIVLFDPLYYPEIAEAISREMRAAGVHPVVSLTFDSPDLVRAESKARPAAETETAVVAFLRPLFEKADMFLWLPGRSLAGDTRWERLMELSRARGVHFHWIQSLQSSSADEIATLSRMYERAILETDYAALSREQDRLIAALRGQTLRITSADGTDLRLTVPKEAWFHKNDGDMSPARARAARSVRDREMEFPAGALRFVPDPASTTGRLVANLGLRAKPIVITLEFEGGLAVRQQSAVMEAEFRQMWTNFGGDIDKVGEIVIGTNPLLVGALPSGTLPYYGYGSGYVRVSMGDNWESGGTNRSPGGRPLWLFLDRASVEAGGRPIVKDGKIV